MGKLRKLTNAVLAGQFTALLSTELLFLLNPEVPHTWTSVLSVFAVFSVSYGLAAGAAFWIILTLAEVLRGEPLQPAWLSFRVLTWLLAMSLAGAAVLLWVNLVNLRPFLPSETRSLLAVAATVVSTAAAAFFVMGLFHYSFGRRGALVSYMLSIVSLLAAVTLPLLLRSRPAEEVPIPPIPLQDVPLARKVTLVGIEGASMSYVLPAVAEGKLPNFARLIESGASGPLRTLYPTESLAIWTSIATGKLPRQHGLKGFYRYRFPGVETYFNIRPRGLDFRSLDRVGLVQRSVSTSALRKTQPFWSILSGFGVDVGVVRWWGSYPADEVRGFVVSEYLHRQVRETPEPPLPHLTHPEELFSRMSADVILPDSIDETMLAQFVDTSVPLENDDFPWKEELTRALADDMTYRTIGSRLREEYQPEVFAIYFFGLDVIGHYFTRYQKPESFGDVSDAEIRRYGRVVESYYRYLDSILGEYMQKRAENETIVILSGHGMEEISLARRILAPLSGSPHLSGIHEDAPDGLLVLNGPGIASGRKLTGASVVDVAPTLLYLMGLPLGRDMDGSLLTDVLDDDIKKSQPVTFISSYRNFLIESRPEGWPDISPLDSLPALLESVE
jgi:predicted AlkP superfamily phosphohydrolase/phosphomutase